MPIEEIEAKSILRKYKRIDSWFISRYGMNLYRGCAHDCVYCDGRAEKYDVEGEFGRDVAVKTKAVDILRRELDPVRRRKPWKPSFIMIGGGVGDAYQPAEKQYRLTRKTLELVLEFGHPVHVLTKSTLVERDLDILKEINAGSRAVVSFSFSSVDDDISARFERNVPPPSDRLNTLAAFKREGIPCGMMLMPVLPFITDDENRLDDSLKAAVDTGLDFVIFSGMTLKPGRQREHLYEMMETHLADLIPKYKEIYRDDPWGSAEKTYQDAIHRTFRHVASKHTIPVRMPLHLFGDVLDDDDRIVVILDHIDYILKLQGKTSSYGYAAYNISTWKEPIAAKRNDLGSIKGIDKTVEDIIKEILDTGTCSLYEKLMNRSW